MITPESDEQECRCPLPVEGMKVTPYGWGDPILSGAFLACANWAASENDAMSAFEKETGLNLNRLAGCSPITAIVDDATGFSRDLVAKWFDWVALNVWGDDSDSH